MAKKVWDNRDLYRICEAAALWAVRAAQMRGAPKQSATGVAKTTPTSEARSNKADELLSLDKES